MEEEQEYVADFEDIPVGVLREKTKSSRDNAVATSDLKEASTKQHETGSRERGRHPYDLVLEEIWEKIFERISDADDLASCMQVCCTFNKLLRDKRTMFMFPKVFKVISINTSLRKKDHVEMRVCRSICKLWREGVDNLYQNLPFFTELDYHAFDEEALKCISAFLCRIWNDPFSTDFNLSPHGLPELQRRMQPWNSAPDKNAVNPFPSRHLSIHDSEDTLREDLEGIFANAEARETFVEMLRSVGRNVWYFTVQLSMGVPSQRYLLLLEWLKWIPNLKVLSLYFRAGDQDFQDVVDENPFPEMEQLTMFQGDKVPNVVLKSVLRANTQIEKIQSQGALSMNPFQQPRLTHAKIRYDDIIEANRNTARYSTLKKLAINFYDASKKALELTEYTVFSCISEDTMETFEIQMWRKPGQEKRVFTILERFEGTLVHFRLGLLENSLGEICHSNGLFEAVCVDLILPLRTWSLKNLEVSAKCRDGYRWIGENNTVTQLYTYLEGRLQEAKIWKLPELKIVFVVDGCDGHLTLFV